MTLRARVAVVFIAIGALVVAMAGGYLAYARWSVGRAGQFEYVVPQAERADWFAPTPPAKLPGTPPLATPSDPSVETPVAVTSEEPAESRPSEPGPSPVPVNIQALFPAQFINPKYWSAPLWAGSDPFGGPGLPDGFERAVSPGQGLLPGASRPASRITIPAIDVDAEVRDLQSIREDDAVSFEAVDKFVGHIPGTANPGEVGTGWYFGHLESPGLGEGNVFHRFPELTTLIKRDPIDVYLYTDSAIYVYRVVETRVVKAEDLSLLYSRESRVALVASFPPRVYTHRLIVFAELFARRLLAEG